MLCNIFHSSEKARTCRLKAIYFSVNYNMEEEFKPDFFKTVNVKKVVDTMQAYEDAYSLCNYLPEKMQYKCKELNKQKMTNEMFKILPELQHK